jgi:hypothetical protein
MKTVIKVWEYAVLLGLGGIFGLVLYLGLIHKGEQNVLAVAKAFGIIS